MLMWMSKCVLDLCWNVSEYIEILEVDKKGVGVVRVNSTSEDKNVKNVWSVCGYRNASIEMSIYIPEHR